ncbi:hypothetical protein J6590_085777, partial [Homalodisca vitripennis]
DALHEVAEIIMEKATLAVEENSEATMRTDIAIAYDRSWKKRGFVSKSFGQKST